LAILHFGKRKFLTRFPAVSAAGNLVKLEPFEYLRARPGYRRIEDLATNSILLIIKIRHKF